MRKVISIMLVLSFVGLAATSLAQTKFTNMYVFNRNYIFGAQDKDASGNLMWNTDGTPRTGAKKVWTGEFTDRTPDPEKPWLWINANPDGIANNIADLSEMYGNGNVYGGDGIDYYSWFDRGGGKVNYCYVNRQWRADRRASEGKQPISAAHPVKVNFDLEAVYDVADMCIWPWAGTGPEGQWYYSGAKDVEVRVSVDGVTWETAASGVVSYPRSINRNGYGAYRVVNFASSPQWEFSAGVEDRDDGYHSWNLGGPWSMPKPIEIGRTARYIQIVITSNWGQGRVGDPEYVGLHEVNFYKVGAMLAFDGPFDVSARKYAKVIEHPDLPYSSGKGPADPDPNAIDVDWTVGPIRLASMGGYPRFWDEDLGDFAPITDNDVTIVGFSGPATEGGGGWEVSTPDDPPFSIPGNTAPNIDMVFKPPTFGEYSSGLSVNWTLPQTGDRVWATTFTVTGLGVNNAWGYLPIYSGKEAFSVGGWSDWGYAWRLDYGQSGGSTDEHPSYGWIRGTRLATARGANSYDSATPTTVDGMWHKLDLGREFSAEEANEIEMWIWPSRWYTGNSMRQVDIHVSNDPNAWASDQGDWQTVAPDHTGWVEVADNEIFPRSAAPYTVQHKVSLAGAPPFRYVKITVDGAAGTGTWGGGRVSLARVRFFKKDAVLFVSPDPNITWPDANILSVNEVPVIVGNVGDADMRLTDLSVVQTQFNGNPYVGAEYFSFPDVGDMGLPKIFTPGTTESTTLVYNPRDFGVHTTRVRVIAENMEGKINAWEIQVSGTCLEFATGFIQGVTVTANAQYSSAAMGATGQWTAQSIADPQGMIEPFPYQRGFKTAKAQGNSWMWGEGTTQRISEAWVELDLQGVHKLDELWIWNNGWLDNSSTWHGPQASLRTFYVEYREDEGDSWRQLGGDDMFYTAFHWGDKHVGQVENPYQATNLVDGDEDWKNNPPLEFNGVSARYVRLSTAGGHHVGTYGDSAMGVVITQLQVYSSVGNIRVSPQVLNFGALAANTTAMKTFDIENESGSPLEVDMVVPLGLDPPYEVLTATPLTVPANGAQTVQVQFAPTEIGDYRNFKVAVIGTFGVMYVTVNAQSFIGGTPDVTVNGIWDVSTVKPNIDFGTFYLPLNTAITPDLAIVKTIALENLGDVALAVSSIVTTTTAGQTGSMDAFSSDLDTITVPAQASPTAPGAGTVTVSFLPLADGNHSGEVYLTSNDPDESPATVTLFGRVVQTTPASVEGSDWMLY